MRSVQTPTHTWKSSEIQELLGQPGAVFWPMNKLAADAKNEIGNFVDEPVDGVSANTMAVADDVVETIRTKEMKEELNLLTR